MPMVAEVQAYGLRLKQKYPQVVMLIPWIVERLGDSYLHRFDCYLQSHCICPVGSNGRSNWADEIAPIVSYPSQKFQDTSMI